MMISDLFGLFFPLHIIHESVISQDKTEYRRFAASAGKTKQEVQNK